MRRFASFHVAGAKIVMNLFHLLTALLGVAVACFIGGAEASPHLQAPKFSTLPTQAGFNCGLVNGKFVCGDKKNTKHNDDDDNATIQTDCDWAKNKNFMHRSFAVVIGDQVNMAGMQIVGWDPVAKQIRSWVFDSDGGFAEGKWTHKGNRWLIQQTGTLPDGSKSSAVNIIKKIDNDSFTWQTVQRSVNGDLLPDVEEVTVVRKPAQGQTASSP